MHQTRIVQQVGSTAIHHRLARARPGGAFWMVRVLRFPGTQYLSTMDKVLIDYLQLFFTSLVVNGSMPQLTTPSHISMMKDSTLCCIA